MAISGPSSYPSTIDEYLTHWNNANTTLGAGNELILPNGTDRAGLSSMKDDLMAKRTELQGKINDREGARADLDILKTALLTRLVQFNEKIRAYFANSKWVRMLPDVPSQTEGQASMMTSLDDANSVWQKLNADPGTATPVTLMGGYTQATFATDVANLRTAYTAITTAEGDERFVREQRNDLQDEIYAVLKSYRQVLPTFFPKGHALIETLPRLTPTGGSTPESLTLSGHWEPNPGYAVLAWTESTDPAFSHYDLRMSIGPVYSTEDDQSIGTFPPGTTGTQTLEGLFTPGSTASFKLYVVLTTGNEAGSNTVVITRP